jgi:methyl-accepting chemotaxis protein
MMMYLLSPKTKSAPVPTAECLDDSPAVIDHSYSEIAAEVLTIGKVLEVVTNQVVEVNKDVEQSVVGVCQGFQGMARQASEAVNAASASLGIGDGGGGKDLISEMRTVVGSLVQKMRASCEFSEMVSERLMDLEKRFVTIEKAMGAIEDLSCRARLVALNGEIEAARLGDAGRAFGVVAQETKVLSDHAADTSNSISELVADLVKDVHTTSSDLRERAQLDLTGFAISERQAIDLLVEIDANQKQMSESLSRSGDLSSALRGEIAQAIVSMQFQDRVSQRLVHVADALQLLIDRAAAHVDPTIETVASQSSQQLLESIASTFTMESERVLVQSNEEKNATPAGSGSGSGGADSFDVELF